MATSKNWFNVDKDGLAKLVAGRGPEFILFELVQNAWDQNVTRVDVSVHYWGGAAGGAVLVSVSDDDPEGFSDLAHAYTLFAESAKKGDAEKRGRFNLGEKLVLALATQAQVSSTKGTITFNGRGRSESAEMKTEAGSCITASFPLPESAVEQMLDGLRRAIAPVPTYVNGLALCNPERVSQFKCRLPTVIGDDRGVLRPRVRMTGVSVYEVPAGRPGWVYEMGIPVVETGDRFDVDVAQKLPLNMDRDNVTPAFLKALRVEVLNVTFDKLDEREVTAGWVREAAADPRVSDEAITSTVNKRFGADAVAFDPSDREAVKISQAEGRQVVYGGSLSPGEWANVRRADAIKRAGVVTPSDRVTGAGSDAIPRDEWRPEFWKLNRFCRDMAASLLPGCADLDVMFVDLPGQSYEATFRRDGSRGVLVFNVARCTGTWFRRGQMSAEIVDLTVHEFGHWFESDHLSRNYYHALSLLAGTMVTLALDRPELFAGSETLAAVARGV